MNIGNVNGNGQPEYGVFSREYLVRFITECDKDRASGLYPVQIADGERLATHFRSVFPDMSDKDMGVMMLVFCEVFAILEQVPANAFSEMLRKTTLSYSHAAAQILRSQLELDTL